MAKQSGIHQIRGKIEGRSYYRQSGVDTGLSRSINQGLSARVKSGDEYINTRKNNAEFGSAADTAKQMAKMVEPKFRPMFLTFSQAKLTTELLRIIKNSTAGAWGQRELPINAIGSMAAALQSLAKNDPSLLIRDIASGNDGTASTHVIFPSVGAADLLASWGAANFYVRAARYSVMAGKFNSADGKFNLGALIQHGNAVQAAPPTPIDPEDSLEIELTNGNVNPPVDSTKTAFAFDVFVIMPYRVVNNSTSILQEHCTFIVKVHDFE